MQHLLFILLLTSGIVQAKGIHLTAGAGGNFSTYSPKSEPTIFGAGLNFKTDFGYFFNQNWAIEVSSQVKFNQQSDLFIWDTLMTAGLRYQFTDGPYYTRVFYGRSPTVIYLDDAPDVVRETNASRLQYNGDVYGFGVGKLYRTEKDTIWFLESALSYQYLQEEIGIRNDGNVPQQVFRGKPDNPIAVYSLYFIIGVRIF
jgi:hypothetical protein